MYKQCLTGKPGQQMGQSQGVLAERLLKKRPISPSPCPLHLFSQEGLRTQGMSVVRNCGGSRSVQNIVVVPLQPSPAIHKHFMASPFFLLSNGNLPPVARPGQADL